MSTSTNQVQQSGPQSTSSFLRIIRFLLIVSFITTSWFIYQLNVIGQPSESSQYNLWWTVAFGFGVLLAIVLFVLAILMWTKLGESLTQRLRQTMDKVSHLRWIAWTWFLFSSIIYGWLLLGPLGFLFNETGVRIWLLWPLVAISSLLFQSIWNNRSFWLVFSATSIWYATIYVILTFLPGISNYPFTLTWSEGSAYYYASLFFSEELYGIRGNLTLINPTRHLLMAIPFLVDDLPIWAHRLWEVILWIVITGVTLVLFVRRLKIHDKFILWVFTAWVFLYLFQGPTYYFLLVSLIPVLWGFDANKPVRTLILVLIGSVWAGASRVNWFPLPGVVAATLYFLEDEIESRSIARYLSKPVLWIAAGMVTALLAWYGYASLSGTPIEQFGIYFTSHLLWYRLFPNATFKGGVLLVSLLVSFPILGFIAVRLYKSGFNYHIIKRLGIALFLLGFFTGGLLVSTKIGGGNNIHNLDAYLIILLITGSYLYFDQAQPDFSQPERRVDPRLSQVFVFFGILIPVIFALNQGKPVNLPRSAKVENALLTVQEFSEQAVNNGGKVLFLAERQLLTFNQLEGVPLVPDYERMTLMEMVMGANEQYLENFHQRIANQEFALIISEPLVIRYKGRSEQFGEENDVFVDAVTKPVLCYYEPVKSISKLPVQILAPKAELDDC